MFLLFLDCVWQLWSQYPARFQLTEDYLLALHDSVQLPLFSSFLANSQRERCRRSQVMQPKCSKLENCSFTFCKRENECQICMAIAPQHLPQSYTPVNGLRELPMGEPEEPVDPPFPPVWDWALQYSSSRRARFTQPVSQPACLPPVLNGNLNTNLERSWVRFTCSRVYVNTHQMLRTIRPSLMEISVVWDNSYINILGHNQMEF